MIAGHANLLGYVYGTRNGTHKRASHVNRNNDDRARKHTARVVAYRLPHCVLTDNNLFAIFVYLNGYSRQKKG